MTQAKKAASRCRLEAVVSGGQTGVDRAALDVALELGIPADGWCPKGRRAEDGAIPPYYPLREADSPDYAQRTRLNVRDSDGTLILHRGALSGGTALTLRFARELDKPVLTVDLDRPPASEAVHEWLCRHHIRTLNVAGPRESGSPGIHRKAACFLKKLLGDQPK